MVKMCENTINNALDRSITAIESLRSQKDAIAEAAALMTKSIESGGTIFFCGNGGSAADSQHAAAELVGHLGLGIDRRPLPAIALTTDTSAITAIANDFGFDSIFARQLAALGKPGDVLVAISTSGVSGNIIKAAQHANGAGIKVIALVGPDKTALSKTADCAIHGRGSDTPCIQAAHAVVLHILCELVETNFIDR